jgi:hypothetical protein
VKKRVLFIPPSITASYELLGLAVGVGATMGE